MKKLTSIILVLSMTFSLMAGSAYASSASATSAQQIVQALGIITGDENGNLNLSGNVTRAQFAKMMITASTYKDAISSTAKASPFKDVKYTHWAASYVQAAVSSGWLTGYTDGTYRPDNSVTLEEAASAVLKMLGYSSSDFTGSFPEAQLAKYAALGLNANISKTQGQVLTRQDCMNLFYNLMSTKNKSGSYYATTLGYTVNSSGELDYSSLVLANMSGPFIVEDSSWSSSLPFSSSTATVYKNGSVSGISSVSNYDVYYYNTSMRTIWVYRNQVSGVYSAATPSTSAPTSVTVAGKTFSVSSSSASYDLSDMGTFGIGDTVTLLLGMNGDVVGVVSSIDVNTTKYGFVASTGTTTYTDSSGNTYTSDIVTVACTDGNTYDYEIDSDYLDKGDLVKISVTGGEAVVVQIGDNSLTGIVNSSGTSVGSYTFSSDVQVMDSTANGSFIKIYTSRLAGLTLNTGDVRYYALDDDGKICQLILNDVTGDMYDYGILTASSSSVSTTSSSATYGYIIDGTAGSYSGSGVYSVENGPVQIEFSGKSIVSMKNLSQIGITTLNTLYAQTEDGKFELGSGVSVYVYKNSSYNLSSISAVNGGGYTLYGYYDRSISAGGRIRVILAYAK